MNWWHFPTPDCQVDVFLSETLLLTSGSPCTGQVALDMALDEKMRQLLDIMPIKKVQRNVQRFEGPLLKVCEGHIVEVIVVL